jgi:hypothetical protein
MDVSLDGAKYHVSEILSKLGVATREEAAAWAPERERRPVWLRGLALAAMLAALAVLAGVGVLAFGVVSNGEAQEGKYVSRDDALLIVGSYNDPGTPGGTPGNFSLEWLPPGTAAQDMGDVEAAASPTEGAWKAVILYDVQVYPASKVPPTECRQLTIYIPDNTRPRLVITKDMVPAPAVAVPFPCGLWASLDRDNELMEIGGWISWRSGSSVPTISLVDEMPAIAAAQKSGLASPRPGPGPAFTPVPNILLVHITGELPTRAPQAFGRWDDAPTIACQDLYIGLGGFHIASPTVGSTQPPADQVDTLYPVIDESTPSNDC